MDNVKHVSLGQAFGAKVPALFLLLDDTFIFFICISIVRAALGRRTVGFLFLPLLSAAGKRPKNIIKRMLLKVLKKIDNVRILTILPFHVEPKFNSIADDWIYDPQLWDLSNSTKERVAERRQNGVAREQLRCGCSGSEEASIVVCAMGRQDEGKGFGTFSNLPTLFKTAVTRVQFAFGGKVASEYAAAFEKFSKAGGIGLNRFISDAELFDFYGAADFVWASYSPDNDQASGIFGRAVQLGIPTIVRKNSMIHRLCEIESFPHIAFDPNAPDELLREMLSFKPSGSIAETQKYMQISLDHLEQALGVPINYRDAN